MKDEQIVAISETLLEAVAYLKKMVEKKSYHELYQMFAMTIEGLQAIQPVLIERKQREELELFNKIERSVVQFSEYIEEKNESGMIQLLQFSLEPNMRRLQRILTKERENESTFTIGIYHDEASPKIAYNSERLEALFNEAKKQDCDIFVFSSEDVDCEREIILAEDALDDDRKIEKNLPDVVYNLFPKILRDQSEIEKWLRERVPFTKFPVGDKLGLPEKLLRESNLGHLFIPFVGVTSIEKVLEFLNIHKKGVLKKSAAARGESIFFVQQKNTDRFVVEVNKKPILMNKEGFTNWISDYILNQRYILQQYKVFQTSKNEPYDIRSHVQKDGNGQWKITRMYPRIGSKKSILSNISTGGRTLNLAQFLSEEFGEQKAKEYSVKLEKLSLEIVENIDRVYNYSIDELGLDLAFDKSGRIWMHEANGVPQTKYHEEERAINAIAYAKYLGENRMFLSNDLQEVTGLKNQYKFDSNQDQIRDLDKNKTTIGLMYDANSTNKEYLEACAIIAHYNQNNFYAFTPEKIDYDNKVIKAKIFEEFEWKERVVRYPDVIYDRLRMKNSVAFNVPYIEFTDIPFTHTLDTSVLHKVEISKQLSKYEQLKSIIIPFVEIKDIEQVLQFIEEHGSIILKPVHGSFAVGIIKLEKVGNRFIWTEDEEIEYSLSQLKRILTQRNIAKNYFAQKFIESKSIDGNPIDIRVHLIKTPNGNWIIAKDYVRISESGFKINTATYTTGRGFSGQTAYVNRYLRRNFPDNDVQMLKDIEQKSIEIAECFDQENDNIISEQALDLALSLEGEIFLIEVNANRPGVFGYEYEIARAMIPYAASLRRRTE